MNHIEAAIHLSAWFATKLHAHTVQGTGFLSASFRGSDTFVSVDVAATETRVDLQRPLESMTYVITSDMDSKIVDEFISQIKDGTEKALTSDKVADWAMELIALTERRSVHSLPPLRLLSKAQAADPFESQHSAADYVIDAGHNVRVQIDHYPETDTTRASVWVLTDPIMQAFNPKHAPRVGYIKLNEILLSKVWRSGVPATDLFDYADGLSTYIDAQQIDMNIGRIGRAIYAHYCNLDGMPDDFGTTFRSEDPEMYGLEFTVGTLRFLLWLEPDACGDYEQARIAVEVSCGKTQIDTVYLRPNITPDAALSDVLDTVDMFDLD